MKSLRRLACYALFFYNICMRSFLQVTEPSSAKALLNLLKCNMCVFLMIFMHACVHQASPNQWRAILRSFQVRDLKIHACIIKHEICPSCMECRCQKMHLIGLLRCGNLACMQLSNMGYSIYIYIIYCHVVLVQDQQTAMVLENLASMVKKEEETWEKKLDKFPHACMHAYFSEVGNTSTHGMHVYTFAGV